MPGKWWVLAAGGAGEVVGAAAGHGAVGKVHLAGGGKTRMSASGAIATAATHGARHSECVADRQTWQVACQVAVRKGLLSAAQQPSAGAADP